jgi:hypothetical protein
MDLVCTFCGEPWHIEYVLHEEPGAFERTGGLIHRCPSCPKHPPQLTPQERERLDTIKELAALLGDDVDGLAGLLEDCNLL